MTGMSPSAQWKTDENRLLAEHILPSDRRFRLMQGDLTIQDVDAIVNAANKHLAHGGGVAGAIVHRGGPEIQRQSDAWIRQHGLVEHDRPALTGAGRLPCRYVIHAVGPVWGEGDEDAKLEAAVRGSLDLATEQGLVSVALPALSTGIFGFPKERAARVITQSVLEFFEDQPLTSVREVRLVVFDRQTADPFRAEFARRWPESILR
jgi:O-acetyl-ADP-ribose deacetylase (regulator of RNase III)